MLFHLRWLEANADVAEAAAAGDRDPVVIAVDDTTRGLQDIARDVRQRSGTKIVAITGSAGKTTTKEVAAEFLSTRYRVFRNTGNFNNHIGLPLSLLELRSRPEVAVVELGMNHPGEIRTLVGIAQPEVRVWTNVGDAHAGFFASTDAIADAKGEILEGARAGDVLVANADDSRIAARAGAFAGRVMTFGLEHPADVRATDIEERGLDGIAARVRTPVGDMDLETPLLGLGNLANVLADGQQALWLMLQQQFNDSLEDPAVKAALPGVKVSLPQESSRQKIEGTRVVSTSVQDAARVAAVAAGLRAAHRRGELLRLPGGLTLIDDSYNSSPAALKRALQTMKTASGSARKIAVLGEMLELGAHSTRLHEECGALAAAVGLDLLIAVGGPPARALAGAAVRSGMAEASVAYVVTSAEAAELAAGRTRPGDLVLVKGSRGIGTDVVVDRLKAEFA